MSTTIQPITVEQIKDMLHQMDLIQRPVTIVYNPKVKELEEHLEKEFSDVAELIPLEYVEEDKVYMIDCKAMELDMNMKEFDFMCTVE